MERGLSQRQACALVRLPRSTLRYVASVSERESEQRLMERLRALKSKQSRVGYRMATQLVRRETGEAFNPKRVYRLWNRPSSPRLPSHAGMEGWYVAAPDRLEQGVEAVLQGFLTFG